MRNVLTISVAWKNGGIEQIVVALFTFTPMCKWSGLIAVTSPTISPEAGYNQEIQ